ncbi:hypothetical protein SAMN06265222_101557 [Neorhodopirellula lusitana]|uniref:Uncharacterized protein n=1 Tax=Neorhodopirellula lusitana TaxID=445327 RepID=A0ABY1PSV8_9BACT|nr:hypothetical protein SAMN06265222_101557 [Neorhodopirellula lusitana]
MRSCISPGVFRFAQLRVGQTHIHSQTHMISHTPASATGAGWRSARTRFGVQHLLQFGDRLKCGGLSNFAQFVFCSTRIGVRQSRAIAG